MCNLQLNTEPARDGNESIVILWDSFLVNHPNNRMVLAWCLKVGTGAANLFGNIKRKCHLFSLLSTIEIVLQVLRRSQTM
jgi:hypothetical protein